MPTYIVKQMIDGQPTFEKPLSEILAECEVGGAVEVLSPIDYHTAQQRRWYKGICLRGLSDWNGDTPEEWDYLLKAACGGELLKSEQLYLGTMSNGQHIVFPRLTIVGVGKRNMTAFIENVLSKAITVGWPVMPPDPELVK